METYSGLKGPSGQFPIENSASLPTRSRVFLNLSFQYELERRKFAQDLIEFDRKYSTMFSGKPRTTDNDDGVSHEEFLRFITRKPLSYVQTG
jgi:hypothetical protein